MDSIEKARQELFFLGKDLLDEIFEQASMQIFPRGAELLVEGQYVKVIPLVVEGAIKVFSRFEEKDLLLYYIKAGESCIMSFSAGMKNMPSRIFAVTEEESKVVLLPTNKVLQWVKEYPSLNNLFYKQYDLRYVDLLSTISEVIFKNLDFRLINYLKKESERTQSEVLKITHRQIASDLGTAREVISRIMKKLEKEQKIKQITDGIVVL
ncbi:MAG: Crp/Fnr family transcriptional regulator [Bacteroidales bacterium]|nr:Crp/Fnr family transcriptional regulator [Bacteroidales bacterium]